MHTNSPNLRRGFTLIELLAAMAITSILVLVILSLTNRGVDIWRRVLQDVRAAGQAHAATMAFAHDVEAMQLRRGNNFEWFWAIADKDLKSGVQNMAMGPRGAKFSNALQLVFFTTAPDKHPPTLSEDAGNPAQSSRSGRQYLGDINAVSYKLEYRDQILDREADASAQAGFPVYALYRNLIPAYRAYDDLMGQMNLRKVFQQYEADQTRPTNFLVENIVEFSLDFEIEYKPRRAAGETSNAAAWRTIKHVPIIARPISGAKSNSYTELSVFGDRLEAFKEGANDVELTGGKMLAVTLSLTVVTEEGMVLVNEIRRGRRAAIKPEEFFSKYTRSYAQRVILPRLE